MQMTTQVNILLYSLMFSVYGNPILVLPWVVMQELDYIKDSQKKRPGRYVSYGVRYKL